MTSLCFVIPAEAGIQGVRSRGLPKAEALDPRLRGDDGLPRFRRDDGSVCSHGAAV
jgi:hypothetical protein